MLNFTDIDLEKADIAIFWCPKTETVKFSLPHCVVIHILFGEPKILMLTAFFLNT